MRPLLFIFTLASFASGADFSKEVFPVLQRACFECHGPEKQKGDLRLDTAAATTHKSIVAGKPEESDLMRRISLPAGDKDAMPKRGDRLKPAEIARLKAWIADGAKWPVDVSKLRHWAYSKPQRPALPAVKDAGWCENEIDRFILAKLDEEGFKPSPRAAAATLIRRVSLDLTGLPPKLDEVLAFEKNPDYEALVDRLLASKEFGVRWARPWLDLARYADSHGFQRDDLREIWGYRDWVVNALNADMPFDQFTLEQVAGDLLPNAKPEQIVATGFHRCTPTNVEAGTEPEESRINQVIDRVNTTGAVWLGTTLECCQCHNHKYDPFTMKDYYSLIAYFNNTEKEAERTNPKTPGSIQFKGVPFAMNDASKDAQRGKLEAQLAALDKQIAVLQTKGKQTPSSSPVASGRTVLHPSEFNTEEGSEHDIQPDGSVLLIGDAPDTDTYIFQSNLSPGTIDAIMIEALTHDSLPGSGPGRGDAARPNFVLQQFSATFTDADGKDALLKFASADCSFAQKGFDPNSLIGIGSDKGWAINPQFSKPHWAVFTLAKPLTVKEGSKVTLRLEQKYGARRTIGCLRVSTISGDVASALPAKEQDEEPEPAKPVKGRKAKAQEKARPAISSDPQIAKLQRQRNLLQRDITALKPMTTEVMKELAEPRMTAIFKRGEYTSPGDPVTPGVPAVFESKVDGPANRLTLAKWLASRENPLAARVTVNRWWAEIFGQGIVTTAEDFGIKGEPPTHPELLDWLAVEFMDHGWSIKHMLKLMVMSAAYRQQSAGMNEAMTDHYARGPRFRMDAEMIRDNALSIAGLLNTKQGGPPIRPPQPDGLWKKVGGQDYKYEVSPGDEQYRRGLYVVLKRGSPYPSFVNFDACARMTAVVKRSRSNTPLQALTLLNDPVYVDATKAFARRIVKQAPSSDLDSRLQFAFRLALSRGSSPHEAQVLKVLWGSQFDAAKSSSARVKELTADYDLQGIAPNEFVAWYAVASALLNLDECITKE